MHSKIYSDLQLQQNLPVAGWYTTWLSFEPHQRGAMLSFQNLIFYTNCSSHNEVPIHNPGYKRLYLNPIINRLLNIC